MRVDMRVYFSIFQYISVYFSTFADALVTDALTLTIIWTDSVDEKLVCVCVEVLRPTQPHGVM